MIDRYRFAIGDANGDGAPDVVGVRGHPDGTVMDVGSSTRGYGECSVVRWFIDNHGLRESEHVVMGDIDGDSGQDLIALSRAGSRLTATVATRREAFADLRSWETGMSADSIDVAAGDFDGDHLSDLFEVTASGRVRIWRAPRFTQLLNDSPIPMAAVTQIAAGDRDGGDRVELFSLDQTGDVGILGWVGGWSLLTSLDSGSSAETVLDMAAGDYDGDGRADLQVLDTSGRLRVHVGNTSTGVPPTQWFTDPEPDCSRAMPLLYDGVFYDDDSSIFETSIEAVAAVGITRGCNPPFKDRFCPRDTVTRETMAAFLVRSLGLEDDTHPGFRDVDPDSTFARDIGRLASAGITRGCNPPANDRFCPKDQVTRETMAAFLVRALELIDEKHPGFHDVPDDSTFAADIRRLARAGITKGCNPPANTEFCPKDPVTRETMAAFLDRAGLAS